MRELSSDKVQDSGGKNYTSDQKMALEFPGNVIVSAGAGSGKTSVLVEKYFRLLADEHPQWPVDSVVAITFTRKAASELKSRIIDRVIKEIGQLDEQELGPQEYASRRRRLKEMRNNIGGAPIGTIHTFCGRILREFAFDAHLDPDYMILEGAQESSLRLQAAREAIAEAIARREHPCYADVLLLLNQYTASRFTTILANMLGGRSSYLKPATRYSGLTLDELYADLEALHHDAVTQQRAEFAREWLAIVQRLQQIAQPGKVASACEEALSLWPANIAENWADFAVTTDQLIDLILTKKLTCRAREFTQAGIEEYNSIRESLEDLAQRYRKTNLSDLGEDDRLDLQRTQRMARVFLHTVEVYTRLRGGDDDGEAQLLDYADMELLAEKLIQSSPEIRQKLRQRYPYLILDEFQDTSQQQWNLLGALATDESGALRPGSLFIVGDKKQGVYGFRDANVTLFAQVQKLVEDSNPTWNNCSGYVSMRANFRTTEAPLTFINRVFENLLSPQNNRFGVEFEPLDLMRTGDAGCVEFLLVGERASGDDLTTAKDTSTLLTEDVADADTEPQIVAAHIQHLLENEQVKPGDIALLFRKRALFTEYEQALKELNIPVVTQQGANLFHQPELADVLAALNSIVYPHKDMIFVHYLRSPLVGFTDNLLLKIARTKGRSYYDKAVRVNAEDRYQLDSEWYELSHAEKERLNFALNLLNVARQMVGAQSPQDIVKYVIDQTGIYYSVMADWRGGQAQANLDKLLAIARESHALSFENFLEYIDSEQQSLSGVGEAVDLTQADAVKIMTIHAAKGLEFPVVYLPSLNSGISGRSGDIETDGDKWMSLRVAKTAMEKPVFLLDYFSATDRLKQMAEERRIFYVAMTRCQTRLILSANDLSQPRSETFYQWIGDEYEIALRDGRLKTISDYQPNLPAVSSHKHSQPRSFKKLSREARLEHALRLANAIGSSVEDDNG